MPQGGIISSSLALIALSGLEERLTKHFKKNRGKIHAIIYADDFVITGESKEILENEVIPLVKKLLN